MAIDLIILTSYFAIKPKDVRGGIGYRYVGLYGSLIKNLLKHSKRSMCFWYSHNDNFMRLVKLNEIKIFETGMIKSIIKAINMILKKKDYLLVIIAYPYAIPKISKIIWYFIIIFILKVLSFNRRIKIIVDYFDFPVEGAYAFSEKRPSIYQIIYYRSLDIINLMFASFVITLTHFWRRYLSKLYHINIDKILICPNGSLTRYIPATSSKPRSSFTVLYAGSALKTKDIDNLILAIDYLKKKGLEIELKIAGAKMMDLPNWVEIGSYDWPTFVNRVLMDADCCVIPYPPHKMGFYYSLPAKLFDYMAAGKPVISTNLKEVRKIIETFNCGLVAENWKQFRNHIEKLYYDRELAIKLGDNSRRTVEKYYDYEVLAKGLLISLIKMFK